MELEKAISDLMTDIKAGFAKAEEQQKQNGSITVEMKADLDKQIKRLDELEAKLSNPGNGREEKSAFEVLKECEPFAKLMKDRQGTAK